MKYPAKVLAYLFHPLLIPLWSIILIFNSGSYISHVPWEVKRAIYLIIAFTSVMMPLLSYGIFYYQKMIRSFDLKEPKQRIFILIIASFYNFITWYLLNRLPISQHIQNFILFYAILSLVFTIIAFRWNISMALGSLGAMCGLVLAFAIRTQIDLSPVFSSVVLISGLVAYGKLKFDLNRPAQLYLGFILGFVIMFVPVIYL